MTWLDELTRAVFKFVPGGLLTAGCLVVFVVWCLWGVNWRRAWPVLAEGGWVPMVLIAGMAAFVWSRVWPSQATVLGLIVVPNFLWHLGSAALLIGVALFCGWLQLRYGCEPAEISLEPPAHGHGHEDHGHEQHGHAALSHNGHTTTH
jgi:hypothetical protein